MDSPNLSGSLGEGVSTQGEPLSRAIAISKLKGKTPERG